MTPPSNLLHRSRTLTLVTLIGLAGVSACKKSQDATGSASSATATKKTAIQNIGSDTMVNLAQAWAEEYAKVEPSISIEVSGGGSGIGIAALINGTAEIANSSRSMEPEEIAKAKAAGHEPKETMVGYDGLAIYVHKSNPIQEITVDELGDLYREGGKIDSWSQLGVKEIPGGKGDKIVRVSRQNNSGTYQYFREAVVGKKKDYKQGSLDMNGSKDVVELVSKTPNAIGYSGLGYATPDVKIVKVAAKKGSPAVKPSIATVLDKTYPIARPLFMYTPGEPSPQAKKYMEWILSDAGQKIVETSGYVPLPKK
ncbi:MAG TPA: phosphate ABC transporter substrate-binding protein [Polyangia bacterium]|jgi:phosphate transport system substrate-binding protein|nr:phosphate ABC transporter substrate-binding protein [Polyangia bacterium]